MDQPSYSRALERGILDRAITQSETLLSACTLCPRRCGVDRTRGERGFCGVGARAVLSSYGPHYGEEPCLVGTGGSGTLFFSGCNLGCLFCQNWEISHDMEGHEVDDGALAAVMLSVQEMGCENINLVTPTHVVPQVLRALRIAAGAGLRLPLVWNSGGYEATGTLGLLEGIVDIYMPDFKWVDARTGERLTGVADYPSRACEALQEMHRQVGDLEVNARGVAETGLLVRHLVMPGGLKRPKAWCVFWQSMCPPDVLSTSWGSTTLVARHLNSRAWTDGSPRKHTIVPWPSPEGPACGWLGELAGLTDAGHVVMGRMVTDDLCDAVKVGQRSQNRQVDVSGDLAL
ncbi:radical SAM protein [Desulfoluna limicola]|uniref:radical SAM protein n=1 Tax=Desulfoluna limicola TaxID=2810562 RepID=UPI001F32C64F|nr:radical SAM protein [Desulfoluna limicola]